VVTLKTALNHEFAKFPPFGGPVVNLSGKPIPGIPGGGSLREPFKVFPGKKGNNPFQIQTPLFKLKKKTFQNLSPKIKFSPSLKTQTPKGPQFKGLNHLSFWG